MASEWRKEGVMTTLGSTMGLAFGPSVIAILAISPFIPPIEAEFGWSRVQVSLAATIVSYMVVLVSPLQGFLVDHFGPRRVILTSIPLFALGLASLYWLPDNRAVYYTIWLSYPGSALACGPWVTCRRSASGLNVNWAWPWGSPMPASGWAALSCP